MKIFILVNSENEFVGAYSNLDSAQIAMREFEFVKDDGYWIREYQLGM